MTIGLKDAPDLTLSPLQTRAHVLSGAAAVKINELPDKTEALRLVNQLARTPLTLEQVFIFPNVPSTDALDSYYWHQDERSLANFAEDATNGIAVMNSHHTGNRFGTQAELPIGRSFFGQVLPAERLYEEVVAGDLGKASSAVLSAAYMLRGQVINGENIDEIIRGIEGGTIFDISVTFMPERAQCDLCENDLFDWMECSHLPGIEYDEGMCTVTSMNARIFEYSPVYDGATPGATILKAEFAAAEGALSRYQIGVFEQRNRVLITPRRSFAMEEGMTKPAKEQKAERTPEDEPEETNEDEPITDETEEPGEEEETDEPTQAQEEEDPVDPDPDDEEPDEDKEETDDEPEDKEDDDERLPSDPSALEALATVGLRYTNNLRTQVLEAGTRAHGTEFDRELWEGLTRKMSIAELERAQVDFDKKAEQAFGPGGRQTEPGDPNKPLGEDDSSDEPSDNRTAQHFRA